MTQYEVTINYNVKVQATNRLDARIQARKLMLLEMKENWGEPEVIYTIKEQKHVS